MYLHRLTLLNFKTYPELDIQFSQKVNCFVGNNGVGKTNLFDAIYYLAFCKSFFNIPDADIATHGHDFFMAEGEYTFEDRTERIQCGYKTDQKKRIRRNDKEYQRIADHIGLIPLVMVSPADSGLITETSEERRRYMNSVISQFDRGYLEDVIQYNKALLYRNKLLKDSGRSGDLDPDLLAVWDDKLAATGDRIFDRRKRFVEELLPIFQKYYTLISGGNEVVSMDYQSQLTEEGTLQLLKRERSRDLQVQFTSAGIHRDDLVFRISGYPIKYQGSQGQQKTYLVSLKMAQYDFLKQVSGVRPLLLLDDVFDKLDAGRVTQIIQLVAEDHFGQIFITDKDQGHLENILGNLPVSYKLFRVKNGSIQTVGNGT